MREGEGERDGGEEVGEEGERERKVGEGEGTSVVDTATKLISVEEVHHRMNQHTRIATESRTDL